MATRPLGEKTGKTATFGPSARRKRATLSIVRAVAGAVAASRAIPVRVVHFRGRPARAPGQQRRGTCCTSAYRLPQDQWRNTLPPWLADQEHPGLDLLHMAPSGHPALPRLSATGGPVANSSLPPKSEQLLRDDAKPSGLALSPQHGVQPRAGGGIVSLSNSFSRRKLAELEQVCYYVSEHLFYPGIGGGVCYLSSWLLPLSSC